MSLKNSIMKKFSFFNRELTTEDGIKYQILENKAEGMSSICINGVKKNVDVVAIPHMINEKYVEVIKKGAFAGNKRITQVSIPEGVREIEAEAFANCVNLKKVELPHSLEVITESCFENCENLRDINIPHSVRKICPNAFKGCNMLDESIVTKENVEIGEGNFVRTETETVYGEDELNGESFVENGIIYNISLDKEHNPIYVNVKGLEENLAELNIPERVRNLEVQVIKKGAFRGKRSIKRVYVPDSVRLIGSEAFKNCVNLEFIEMPAELNVINESTFEGCTSLTTAVLPYELKRIAQNAFKDCRKLSQTYHYTKTGIGITMTLDKTLKEQKLPSGLEYIGKGAFWGCESIKDVYLPIEVSEIDKDTFRDCTSLESVRLHNKTKKILSGAFLGCTSLGRVRLPNSITRLASDAFDKQVCFVCNERLQKRLRTLQAKDVNVALVNPNALDIDSKMIPGDTTRFYSDEALANALDYYESRSPMDGIVENHNSPLKVETPTRYTLENDQYCYNNGKDSARIMLTGDLMCRFRQMASAYRKDEGYSFEAWHEHVKPILTRGDLVIGNMESMVSNSFLYSDKASFVDDRVHLNAPDSFVESIKNAGFDFVVNAQNHAYDTGTQGLFETLDVLNRAQLMHTGLFAGKDEKRFVSLNVNGFRVAVLAYFDQARQPMKRANFTKEGLDCLFNTFKEDQIKADVKRAKAEGAEFIIAYSHCGREYTDQVSKRQANFAKMLADAGVDYIFGCHSHCIQPYREIKASDGRIVPVLYSGGNFCSDMSIKMPYVRDTLIGELVLVRDEKGKVAIQRNGYHPCLIKYDREVRGNIVTVPISTLLNTTEGEELATAEADLKRIVETVDGNNYECILLNKDGEA